MNLQKLIHECLDLKSNKNIEFDTDLGSCQTELNRYLIYLEGIKPKQKIESVKLDCEYCGRKYADTACMNSPNPCKKPR